MKIQPQCYMQYSIFSSRYKVYFTSYSRITINRYAASAETSSDT